MSYEDIDPVIEAWAAEIGSPVFKRVEGREDWPEFRCVYLQGDRGECFQIWVDVPEAGNVGVHAAGVETSDDEEFRVDWVFSQRDLRIGLEQAKRQVSTWLHR